MSSLSLGLGLTSVPVLSGLPSYRYIGLHPSVIGTFPSNTRTLYPTRAETSDVNSAGDIYTADGTEVVNQIGGYFTNPNLGNAIINIALYDTDGSSPAIPVNLIPSSEADLTLTPSWDALTDGEAVASLSDVRLEGGKRYVVAYANDSSNGTVYSAHAELTPVSLFQTARDASITGGQLADTWTTNGANNPVHAVAWARYTKLTTLPPALTAVSGVIYDGGSQNSVALNVNADNTKVWGSASNTLPIFEFLQSDLTDRTQVNDGSGLNGIVNGAASGWTGAHNTPDGNVLFVHYTDTDATYLFRSADDGANLGTGAGATDKYPVLALGSTNADGSATSTAITAFADGGGGTVDVTAAGHGLADGQGVEINGTTNYDGAYAITLIDTDNFTITATWVSNDATGSVITQVAGRRRLGLTSFINCTLSISAPDDTPDAILMAEYISGGIQNALTTVWYSLDDGITWAVFWRSGLVGETQHRKHIHSIWQHPTTNEIIICCGDSSTESAIIKGPNDPAEWAAVNSVSNTTIAGTSGFKIYHGDQKYRAIHLLFHDGYIHYGADAAGSATGIYRFKDDFTDADVTKVFGGLSDRFERFDVRGGALGLVHSNGTLLTFDWIEGGGSPSTVVQEIRVHASINGTDWFTIGEILGETDKLPGNYFNFTNIMELADGRILIDGAGRWSLRGYPTTTDTHADEGILMEFGDTWNPASGVAVLGPSSWVV